MINNLSIVNNTQYSAEGGCLALSSIVTCSRGLGLCVDVAALGRVDRNGVFRDKKDVEE